MVFRLSMFLILFLLASARVELTDGEWRERLGSERYRIMREKGTERAFSGAYLNEWRAGTYACAACDHPLFSSEDKYEEPGSGWIAFSQTIGSKNVLYKEDWQLPFKRYEVLCRDCESHLGHVFKDGPPPKNLRYTINSLSLSFKGSQKP
jgi:peptide-methionine (R)-S-oxide reductase